MEQKERLHTSANPVETVLSGLYKNACVGADAISALLCEVDNGKLRRELFEQRTWYRSQMQRIRAQMAEIWLEPLERGETARKWSRFMIRAKARVGMTVQAAAKLMVEGTQMGMVQLHQLLNRAENIPDDLRAQVQDILTHEQGLLDRLCPYL